MHMFDPSRFSRVLESHCISKRLITVQNALINIAENSVIIKRQLAPNLSVTNFKTSRQFIEQGRQSLSKRHNNHIMEDFFIDKIGKDGKEEENLNSVHSGDDDGADNFVDEKQLDLYDQLSETLHPAEEKKPKKNEFSFDDTYLITSYRNKKEELITSNVDEILKKSNIPPGLEKKNFIPYKSDKRLKLERKREREKTKGEKWFNIPATRMTEEIKTDFEVLKMRAVLDKHHVYKKNDITRIPKYFQVGKVVENAADFYSGRIPKSQRKKTMVDELLADAEFKKYQKKKYKEIMDEQRWKKLSKRKKMKEKSKVKLAK